MDINYHWYHRSLTFLSWVLLPFSFLFRGIVALRLQLFQRGILKSYSIPVPVIIVGNISVGGTGKTPTVIWLANFLKAEGYFPGIITRGYKGSSQNSVFVDAQSQSKEVGDEAILLRQQTLCPVVVNKNRVDAAKDLLAKNNCNVIISDDGLQHYRLKRSIEIAIVDNTRRFGNGELLPAGPLREPISRLNKVDFIFSHPFCEDDEYLINYVPKYFCNMKDANIQMPLKHFAKRKVHAIAAIGHPQRFFETLKDLQIEVIEHRFPDHYQFEKTDVYFDDDLPVIMTEKDAVKCRDFAEERHWFLAIEIEVDEVVKEKLLHKLGDKL